MSQPGEHPAELPSASLFRSRAVCKAWHRITTEPSFLAAHADRRPAELLVVSRGEPSFLDAIPLSLQLDDLMRRQSQLHCPKHCEVRALMGSCDGLVLFQKSRESLFKSDFFVCNPVTRQGARLDLKPPSCPDVARLCGFYRHGQGRPLADGVVVDEFAYFIDHYAHHRGKIHWTIHPLARSAEKILAFDTVSKDFRLISRPPWPRDHYRDNDLCLLELDGRLAVTATELHGDSVELWVLEEYDDEQSWSHRFRIVLPPGFSPDWWTGTGVPNVVFVASYTYNFKALYHLTEKRIVKQIEYINGTWGYCYLFKDSLVPHSFLNPY
ncbi:uncharacterized protein [Triticum aestivum]|uniref:uncharacterized protein n=1 Tax=Triticum aestivum TaxID=4565 RepID=UPI001D02AE87|nr:uncharacterized protein LOC123083704 [Triticum aestivum]